METWSRCRDRIVACPALEFRDVMLVCKNLLYNSLRHLEFINEGQLLAIP